MAQVRLDIRSVTHNLEMVGYVYYDSKTIYEGMNARYFNNDMFSLKIYSDKDEIVNSIVIHKLSIESDKFIEQEGICTTNKIGNGIFLIDDVPVEDVLEILYTTPNDEVIEELRKLSIEKTLEPLNG